MVSSIKPQPPTLTVSLAKLSSYGEVSFRNMLFLAWLLLGMGLTILALALAISFIVLFLMVWGWLGTAIARLFRKARDHD
jgi:hypothetical protein